MNTASRLQSHGTPNSVHLSQVAFDVATNNAGFDPGSFDRHSMLVKSKGRMTTYTYPRPPSHASSMSCDAQGLAEMLRAEEWAEELRRSEAEKGVADFLRSLNLDPEYERECEREAQREAQSGMCITQ
jgi:hypothetical protein